MENLMQNHPVKNSPLDKEKWREIIEAWNKSGENQKAYCQRLGISINTFTYARGKMMLHDKPKAQFIPVTVNNNSAEKNMPQSAIVLENR
jgi:predicted enzyme involved in methoxymalonyl-ACP biosynthesis